MDDRIISNMFGETVVGYEKKWQRFKKAFDELYSELRETLSNARSMKGYYEESLKSKKTAVHTDEIEKLLRELAFKGHTTLPLAQMDRYPKLKEDLILIRKYVEYLKKCAGDNITFTDVDAHIANRKTQSAKYQSDRKKRTDRIADLATETSELQHKIFDERKSVQSINSRLESINSTIKNWNIVERILGNAETLALVNALIKELEDLDRELLYISKIEQRTSLVKFLRLGSYGRMTSADRSDAEDELAEMNNKASLLHDIICMANNQVGREAYMQLSFFV